MNWSCQPILDSYLAVAVLAAGLLLSLAVGPGRQRISAARRRVLLALRLLVAGVVILLMLRPTYTSTQTRPQSAALVVLLDQSRSMQLPDAAGDRSRWEAQVATLRQIEPLLRSLSKDLDIRVQAYDRDIRASAWQDGRLVLPAQADGAQTDIGTSLHHALERELGKRLVGVIVLGDGAQTAYQPDIDLYDVARELGNRGYPLYTVSYGPAGDAAESRDVAVESLPEQYQVFVKNELAVRGLVRVRGYVNKQIPVTLIIEDPQGGQQRVGPLNIQASEDNQQLDASLTYTPQNPGQYRLILEAAEQPGELVTKNNRLSAFLTVREGGLRVLFLEGEPRQEQKFIRWALDASPDIDLDFQWFPSRLRSMWPIAIGETLARGNYDAYILGDCDSLALGDAGLQQLADEVERGKGLMALGGYHSFDPGGYRNTPLNAVLPVVMDRLARQDFGRPDVQRWHVPGPLVMLPTRSHPVTTLGPTPENEQLWRSLRPLQGANRWAGLREAPGVQLLAATSEQVPLLVSGEYGAGRVLAFAGDSTWQWWRQGLSALHRRFWRQAILWLARRDDLTRNDVWIDLPQRRFSSGARVAFSAGARTALGDALPGAVLAASLQGPDGGSSPLRLGRQGGDVTGALERAMAPGNYQLHVTAVDAAHQPLGAATAQFEVLDEDVEFANPAADPDQMMRLASLTRESGGRAVAPEQLPALLAEIQRNPPRLVEEVLTRWQLGDTSQDAWSALGCLVGLLTLEWFLRKRWGLV